MSLLSRRVRISYLLRLVKMSNGAASNKKRVVLLGSGNWGCAIARIVGQNAVELEDYEDQVNMYVFEETIKGRKLTEIINSEHENVKYLPGYKLPPNVVAVPDAAEAARGADVLVICLPHQFLPRLLAVVKPVIKPGAVAVSLIKGHVEISEGRPVLGSAVIRETLEVETAVLMGANVANEVARGDFCEATLALPDSNTANWLRRIFNRPTFSVRASTDVPGTELCGGLKNVIALAGGFCDGLGLGGNTKAAVVRTGLLEMSTFIQHFFPSSTRDTLFESCGLADLVTTSFGGRNRKCAEAYARDPARGWDKIEAELLGGQKLQGVSTVKEIWPLIEARRLKRQLPLIRTIYRIAVEGAHPRTLLDFASDEGPVCPGAGLQAKPIKVSVLGAGNRATCVARLVAANASELEEFENCVRLYVAEEMVEGRSLSDIINQDHENLKYLSGYKIPENVVATSDAMEAVRDADILIVGERVAALQGLLQAIKGHIKAGAVAVSLSAGVVDVTDSKPLLVSELIQQELGIETAVLAGANVSLEVAAGHFCEATLATAGRTGGLLPHLFHRPTFQVREVHDVAGVEMSAALTRTYVLATGFCDGLGLGGNTKAAVIRIALLEVAKFAAKFFPSAKRETLFESCGLAGIISMSLSSASRHRTCAQKFAEHMRRLRCLSGQTPAVVTIPCWKAYAAAAWSHIQQVEMGQPTIEGIDTLRQLWPLVVEKELHKELPLMASLHRIAVCGDDPKTLLLEQPSKAPLTPVPPSQPKGEGSFSSLPRVSSAARSGVATAAS
eukprot:TRINITY_DN83150_c0_g1_i1.p1 TRINITY_DN83150_c0_g1~~TRINITY_DN83150_c0_g1_i1.p1  ORF type:complete len:787 (-),score=201.19 TRINITY_DN83150_c0_g1_i1:191-2551(-)